MHKKLGIATPPSLLTRVLFRIFDAMSCGAILLDQSKRIVHLNDRGRTCLGQSLSLASGRLCATDRACDALFQAMMDDFLAAGAVRRQPKREAIGLKRQDGRAPIVRVVPVEPETKDHMDGAALVLIIVDPEDCPFPSHAILHQVFGLTKGEARVANHLLCGQSLQEIADTVGVSLGTVRSQTKALFAKTHTNRQAELVALLMRLAVISEEGDWT